MTDITITPPEVITVTATSPTAYTITVTQPAAVTVSAALGASGTVTSITTTAPITGGTITGTGTIGISAATTAAAGSMSASDKTKLDGIEAGAEVNNISDVNATDLTDGGTTSLHSHANDHARQHSITSTSDHTSTATSGQMLKADVNGLPVNATNTDAQVSAAVTASHAAVTIGTANGLSLATQALSLGLASAGVTGALSGTDWSTFNAKEPAITILQASKGGTGVNNSFNLTISGTSTVNGSLVGSMTGGGTVATGGFTLTVAEAMSAAGRNVANTFTQPQTITETTSGLTNGLIISGASKFGNFQGLDAGSQSFVFFGNNRTYGAGWGATGWYGDRKAGLVQVQDDEFLFYQFAASSNSPTNVFRIFTGGLGGFASGNWTIGALALGTAQFTVQGVSDIVQSRVLSHSTQTANIATWESSAGAVYVSISGTGVFFPRQTTTAAAPAYVKGGIYFDTTLNKLMVGGATAWEAVTSV